MGRTRTQSGTAQDADIKQVALRSRNQAYEIMVCRYRQQLLWHVAKITKDMESAEEIVNETFIRAIHEVRIFNQGFRIKAWLYRVASNCAFNYIRNRKRRLALLEQRAEELVDQVPLDFDEELLSTQRQTLLQPHLDRLSRDHRQVIHLRFWMGLSYQEISDTLGIKLGTVMSRLSRAKGELREKLANYGLNVESFAIAA